MSTNLAEKETTRLENFSDAVFAIVITLLALDLKTPRHQGMVSSATLARLLLSQWPVYIAFLTSFATVLIMWVHHHSIFQMIRKSNVLLKFANGFLLMCVTLVPFSTSLLSEYLNTPAGSLAAAVYVGLFVVIDLSYNGLLWSAIRERTLLKTSVSDNEINRYIRNYLLGIPLYLVTTILAFRSPYVAVGICFVLWMFWALNGGRSSR